MSYEASQSSLIPASRNALAPRGGVAFDGTSGSRVYSTLTNQSIGTDPFSVSLVVRVPTTNPINYPSLFQLNSILGGLASPNSLRAEIDTAGTLTFVLDAASDAHNNTATVPGFVAAWAGKVINLVFVRAATGNPSLYINGVSQTLTFGTNGTPPTWQGSVSNGYFQVGSSTNGREIKETIYSATLYNCALAQADVTEIYELGGAVRERDKFGSQVARYTSDFSAGLDGFNAAGGGYATLTCSGNVDTSADGASIPPSDDWQRADQSGTGRITYYSNSSAGLAVYQKTMRITGSIFIPAGSTVTHMVVGFEVVNTTNEGYISTGGLGFIAGSVVALTPGSTTNFNVTAINTAAGSTRAIYFVGSNSAGVAQNYTAQKVYVKNVVVRQVGAVVHLDGESDGFGFQWHDQSTNKLDAVRTEAGVSWTKPKLTPTYFRGFTATAGDAQVALTPFVRGPARIMAIYAKASGAATVTVGLFSAGVELVASVALTVGVEYQKLTIKSGAASFYNGDGVCTNTNLSIWVNSTTANRIDWYVTWEPINP